tara:strand:- start:6 stop:866 length:861 start_codon:yes stop_codon:yes gene_type:complete
MILDLPIEARNLSAQMAHKEEVPSYASIKIRGTGRDLFKSILLKNYAGFKLVLDLEGISEEYEFNLNDYFEKYPRKVVLPLNYNLSFVEVIHPNRIKISLDEYQVKKVPIISNLYISPSPGYMLVGDIKLKPKMIEIAGPKEEIALINHVDTAYDTISNITNAYLGNVKIFSKKNLIKYSPTFVEVSLDIQQISEKIIADIPVIINDVPEKIRVFPSPQTVSLTVVGGLQRIAFLRPDEINVFISFNDWNSQIQFYEPDVVLPSGILNWKDISPKNLEIAVAREIR